MKFIVNEKIYDTAKAELLCTFNRQWRTSNSAFFDFKYTWRKTRLYKTKKGNYFLIGNELVMNYIEVVSEYEAKKYLLDYNYKKYAELFGELEEA